MSIDFSTEYTTEDINVYLDTVNTSTSTSTCSCCTTTSSEFAECTSSVEYCNETSKYIIINTGGEYDLLMGCKYLVTTRNHCIFTLPEYPPMCHENLQNIEIYEIVIKVVMGNHIVTVHDDRTINYFSSSICLGKENQIGEFFAEGVDWKAITY